MTTSLGTVTPDPPDARHHPHRPGGVVDGVRILFQMTPGTEAPAEMNFLFPDQAALHGRERHPQPAQPADPARRAGARPARLVALPQRGHRPVRRRHSTSPSPRTTGRRGAASGSSTYLSQQRDLYGYLHDQTLRLMNQGYTGTEIAEMIELPPALEKAWHTHGYYGSVSHNVKAIYQRYLGWFDGNPAHLWQHPPVEQAGATSSPWAGPTRCWPRRRGLVRRRRLPLGGRACQPRRLRRPDQRGGPRPAGAHLRAARLRRRERHLAQLLPHRRARAARTASAPPRPRRPPTCSRR